MATHSSIPACRIPWPEGPGGLQSVRSQRVGYVLATKQWQQQLIYFFFGCCAFGVLPNQLLLNPR